MINRHHNDGNGGTFMNIFDSENAKMLVSALLSLKNEQQCRSFLEDLMTSKEIISLSQRLAVAKLLCEKGKYSEVSGLTGASSATIGRVNRCIQYGSGGYRAVLENLGVIDGEAGNGA